MGFFGKLKQNFNHGGVKLQLQAPGTVSESDAGFTVNITIQNTSETAQTIKSVATRLIEDHMQPMVGNTSNNQVDGPSQQKEIANAQETNPFVMQPGETKQLSMTVPLNFGKLAGQLAGDNPVMQAAANLLSGIQTATDLMDTSRFQHYIIVSADVDGITFDPSARQNIQVLKPGQIGTSFGVQL